MKKLNKKGFTLIELLAVLVILITILTIAIPSIAALVDRQKDKMLKEKEKFIEALAETFVNQYKNKFDDYDSFVGRSCCIKLEELTSRGLLTEEDLYLEKENKLDGKVCMEGNEYKYKKQEEAATDCVINN